MPADSCTQRSGEAGVKDKAEGFCRTHLGIWGSMAWGLGFREGFYRYLLQGGEESIHAKKGFRNP